MGYVADWLLGVFIFVLRQVLRARYLLLVAAIALLFMGARAFVGGQSAAFWGTVAVFVVLFLIVDGVGSGQKSPFYWNFEAEKRRERIAELLRSCQKSLLIVSGECGSEVFESQLVLNALECLPQTCAIELYITNAEIDPKSVRFMAWMRSRGVTAQRLSQPIAHRIVVDDMNVRVEFRHSGIVGKGRPAMVAYGEPRLASEARRAVYRAMAI